MKSGREVIREIGKHGLRGYFFSFRQYQDLAKISDFGEVRRKIAGWGYPEALNAKNAEEIVSILRKPSSMSDKEKGCLAAMVLEPLFWLILFGLGGC